MLANCSEQHALALTEVICPLEGIDARESVQIRCEAPDAEVLFTDWLNALIYEMSTRNLLFSRFAVDIRDYRLTATAWGEALDRERHHPTVEVKAATYTALLVTQRDDGSWIAQCVVDV